MPAAEPAPYRVLARKYRPRNFGELIGQDALVRTLTNAITTGRIHHAYMLTGIRGTGKTTTARLIARALNYTGKDGKASPTAGPTDDCAICQAIAEGRQPDVLEMDAASRRGIDDIRELIDGVRYAPTSARYKVYIIDEVHMLTPQAFNALLKTLEEPPPHVIFILATTEIRAVPVTVLSRCQRFDLRRIDVPTLAAYYATICEREKVKAEPEALQLIARAAEGSVRDGLSLLDQAIARGDGTKGGIIVTADTVRGMLGLSDRSRVLDVLDAALSGDCARALDVMTEMYAVGGHAAILMQDLLDYVHTLTRLRAAPQSISLDTLAPAEAARAQTMANRFAIGTLGRAWQLLLKGLHEVSGAPDAQAAAEMAVIRLSYAAGLPDPADLIKKLKSDGGSLSSSPNSLSSAPRTPEPVALRAIAGGGPMSTPMPQPALQEQSPLVTAVTLDSLASIEALLLSAREMILATELASYVRLIAIQPGLVTIRQEPQLRTAFAGELGKTLSTIAGTRWIVTVEQKGGGQTLAEERAAANETLLAAARENPIVAAALRLFPGAELTVKPSKEPE